MEELYPDENIKKLTRKGIASLALTILCTISVPSVSHAVEIHAVSFQLPSPPFLSGNLESNTILAEAERVQEGKISSPHSYVRYKGMSDEEIYAVTSSGTVVNVAPCRPVVIADLTPRSCKEIYAVTSSGTVVNVAPCRPVVIADLTPRSCSENSFRE
ncbi:hypothetical protein PoB_004278300 [Plakobranchus ocellatus]|uniref:Uncharacterized protein n=1 Tax=Plakobranchus ocellatus TaxID=259542 RepID=A0AAV4BAU1_9GAST|nr:hypothetical protein PoB_004278300 [Plakobranchus ocellatus]